MEKLMLEERELYLESPPTKGNGYCPRHGQIAGAADEGAEEANQGGGGIPWARGAGEARIQCWCGRTRSCLNPFSTVGRRGGAGNADLLVPGP
jgi:hypothetical protein